MVSFALVESGHLLDLKFTSFGEWLFTYLKFTLFEEQVFTQVNSWERCFQNLRECYDCSEFLDLQREFKLFLGGSAWQGHPGDVPGLKVLVDLTSHQDM